MEMIFEGTLKKSGESGMRPFWVRRLAEEDLADILHVQDQVFDHLENKEVLQPLSAEEFQYILRGNGLLIGAFDGDVLIGFRALLVPPIEEEHLGMDIGLAERDLAAVIYQEISNVLPDYRGNRLQKVLAELIMKELAKEPHPYRYVCCTVAPFNIPSLKDKLAQGMQIAALKEKYGGLLRYIFVKDLMKEEEDSAAVAENHRDTVRIQMGDITAQQEKLAAGWRGISMEQGQDGVWVHYVHNGH